MPEIKREEKAEASTSTRVRIAPNTEKFAAEREELKRQSTNLIEETNRTFKELTTTLNNEQNRLSSLEERRQKLLMEIKDVKEEIEKEKEACRKDLEATNHEDTDSLDSWYGLNDEEVEKKQSILAAARESTLPKQPVLEASTKKRRSSVEIADDIVNRLEFLAKRQSTAEP